MKNQNFFKKMSASLALVGVFTGASIVSAMPATAATIKKVNVYVKTTDGPKKLESYQVDGDGVETIEISHDKETNLNTKNAVIKLPDCDVNNIATIPNSGINFNSCEYHSGVYKVPAKYTDSDTLNIALDTIIEYNINYKAKGPDSDKVFPFLNAWGKIKAGERYKYENDTKEYTMPKSTGESIPGYNPEDNSVYIPMNLVGEGKTHEKFDQIVFDAKTNPPENQNDKEPIEYTFIFRTEDKILTPVKGNFLPGTRVEFELPKQCYDSNGEETCKYVLKDPEKYKLKDGITVGDEDPEESSNKYALITPEKNDSNIVIMMEMVNKDGTPIVKEGNDDLFSNGDEISKEDGTLKPSNGPQKPEDGDDNGNGDGGTTTTPTTSENPDDSTTTTTTTTSSTTTTTSSNNSDTKTSTSVATTTTKAPDVDIKDVLDALGKTDKNLDNNDGAVSKMTPADKSFAEPVASENNNDNGLVKGSSNDEGNNSGGGFTFGSEPYYPKLRNESGGSSVGNISLNENGPEVQTGGTVEHKKSIADRITELFNL